MSGPIRHDLGSNLHGTGQKFGMTDQWYSTSHLHVYIIDKRDNSRVANMNVGWKVVDGDPNQIAFCDAFTMLGVFTGILGNAAGTVIGTGLVLGGIFCGQFKALSGG